MTDRPFLDDHVPTLHKVPMHGQDYIEISITCSCGWKSKDWAVESIEIKADTFKAKAALIEAWRAMWEHVARLAISHLEVERVERKRIARDLSAVAAADSIDQQARLAYLQAIRIVRGGDDV